MCNHEHNKYNIINCEYDFINLKDFMRLTLKRSFENTAMTRYKSLLN